MKRNLAIIASLALLLTAGTPLLAQGNSQNAGRPENPGNSQNASGRQTDKTSEQESVAVDEIRQNNSNANKVNITTKNPNRLQYTVETEENEVVEESTDSGEIVVNDPEEEIKIRGRNNAAMVIRNRVAAQTHFPLQVNLDTNELIVTTPAGSKVVAILPDEAVANMLAANILDQAGGKGGLNWLASQTATPVATDSATPSSTPSATVSPLPTSTASAEPSPVATESATTEEPEIVVELIETENGQLVYQIEGVKTENLLGFIPVSLDRTVFVSADTGELIEIEQSLLTQIIDAISFE